MPGRHLQLTLSLIDTLVGSLEFPLLVLSDRNSLDVVVSPLATTLIPYPYPVLNSLKSLLHTDTLWSSGEEFLITQVWLTYSGIHAPLTTCWYEVQSPPRPAMPVLFFLCCPSPFSFPIQESRKVRCVLQLPGTHVKQ